MKKSGSSYIKFVFKLNSCAPKGTSGFFLEVNPGILFVSSLTVITVITWCTCFNLPGVMNFGMIQEICVEKRSESVNILRNPSSVFTCSLHAVGSEELMLLMLLGLLVCSIYNGCFYNVANISFSLSIKWS